MSKKRKVVKSHILYLVRREVGQLDCSDCQQVLSRNCRDFGWLQRNVLRPGGLPGGQCFADVGRLRKQAGPGITGTAHADA